MKSSKSIGSALTGRRHEQSKSVSAREYLKLTASEKGRIESARVIAPKLGDGAFGRIELTYK